MPGNIVKTQSIAELNLTTPFTVPIIIILSLNVALPVIVSWLEEVSLNVALPVIVQVFILFPLNTHSVNGRSSSPTTAPVTVPPPQRLSVPKVMVPPVAYVNLALPLIVHAL